MQKSTPLKLPVGKENHCSMDAWQIVTFKQILFPLNMCQRHQILYHLTPTSVINLSIQGNFLRVSHLFT